MTWGEARADEKKRAKVKPELCKPFEVRSFRFFPCAWADSLARGFKYYLLMKHRRRGHLIGETASPRFRMRDECVAFTEGNRCFRHPLA